MRRLLLILTFFGLSPAYCQDLQYIRGQYELQSIYLSPFVQWIAVQHFLFNPDVDSSVLIKAKSYRNDRLDIRCTRQNDSSFCLKIENSNFPLEDSVTGFNLINGFIKYELFQPEDILTDSAEYTIRTYEVRKIDTTYKVRKLYRIDPSNRFNFQSWTSTSYSEEKDSSGFWVWRTGFNTAKGKKVFHQFIDYTIPVSKIDSDSLLLVNYSHRVHLADSSEEQERLTENCEWLKRTSGKKYKHYESSLMKPLTKGKLKVNKHRCVIYYEAPGLYSFEIIPDGRQSKKYKKLPK